MAVLVTGGAGYIGSAFVEALVATGEPAVVLDDLSRGHRASLHPEAALYRGSLRLMDSPLGGLRAQLELPGS